jgi:ribosomal protein S12 methylthiotransferase
MQNGLVKLLEAIIPAVPDIPWIRLMYTFPGYVKDPLIELMASERKILPYLDMPLQHADPNVLQTMRRPQDIIGVHDTLSRVRALMPEVALRTTFIIGYPGEDDKAFQNLINFVQAVRFDHIGVFPYSFEPGTPAETLGNPIPEHIKTERIEHLMKVQSEISLEKNQTFIGKTLDILIEGIDQENQISVGRSYRDAPEIDGLVIIEGIAPIGELVPVHITSAITHDLVGELVSSD